MADKVTRFTDNEVVTTAVFNQRVDETNAAFAVVDEAIDGLSGTGGEIPAIREKDVQQDARLGTLETAAAAARAGYRRERRAGRCAGHANRGTGSDAWTAWDGHYGTQDRR